VSSLAGLARRNATKHSAEETAAGIRVLGIRIPAYIGEDKPYISRSWDWLESTLSGLHDAPTIVAGDFNVNVDSRRAKGGDHFRRILANGWHRSAPKGQGSYFGPSGRRAEIDHILCNSGLSRARPALMSVE
jgi:endonuclease/exonuclease/phosphatase family metal-dependent hydrolase